MSVIKFEDFEKIVKNKESNDADLGSLILEIAKLRKQLSEKEKQSFYWRKAEPSHREKLQKMEDEFNNIKGLVNNNSLDFFIDKLVDTKNEYDDRRNKGPRGSILMYRMVLNILESDIEYIESLLGLKQKFEKLLDLDEYLENSEELTKLIS